jgi:hypothetical protein
VLVEFQKLLKDDTSPEQATPAWGFDRPKIVDMFRGACAALNRNVNAAREILPSISLLCPAI